MLTRKLVLKLLPFYLLMVVVFSWPLVWPQLVQRVAADNNRTRLNSVEVKKEPAISGQPVQLEIPRLKIKLTVQPGGYDNGNQTWRLDEEHAFYAKETASVNNRHGHTLIYGHDLPEVLRPTKRLAEGDQLIITTRSGRQLEYYFVTAADVEPSDVSVLDKQTEEPEVTLLTCSGTFEQVRRLMSFKYLRAL